MPCFVPKRCYLALVMQFRLVDFQQLLEAVHLALTYLAKEVHDNFNSSRLVMDKLIDWWFNKRKLQPKIQEPTELLTNYKSLVIVYSLLCNLFHLRKLISFQVYEPLEAPGFQRYKNFQKKE